MGNSCFRVDITLAMIPEVVVSSIQVIVVAIIPEIRALILEIIEVII